MIYVIIHNSYSKQALRDSINWIETNFVNQYQQKIN